MVQFLRLLTSATMRVSPDEYVAYLYDSDGDASMSVDGFCANNVETMGREAGTHVCSIVATEINQ